MARVVLAVVAGFVVWSVMWIGLGAVMPALSQESFNEQGVPTQAGVLVALLVGSVVCSVASGWTAARIAPQQARPAAIALGIVLLAVGIAVQASLWDAMPLWFHLPFLALLVPATLLGAKLRSPGAVAPASELATAR